MLSKALKYCSFGFIILIIIICFNLKRTSEDGIVGIYWGAFDPPTEAHYAIITASMTQIPLKKLYLVVNNSSYKNYSLPLSERIQHIQSYIHKNGINNVEIISQDDIQKIDYTYLRKKTKSSLYAIAGYDSYLAWIKHTKPEERNLYDGIAVVPRGDDTPILIDKNAFLLPIDEKYKYISSTKVRGYDSRNLLKKDLTDVETLKAS